MHVLDASILLAFAVFSVCSGLRNKGRASEGLTEYFLAGRSLGGTAAGLSMAATQFAADTPLLVTGLIATSGVFGLWRLWIYAVSFLLLGFVLAPCWRRARVLTDAELCEVRYSGDAALLLRGVKAVYFGVVFNCAVLAMVLFAAARIGEPFLRWHAWLPDAAFEPVLALVEAVGVSLSDAAGAARWVHTADNALSLLCILVLTGFYSTAGGLRSVVRTDLVQLGLALFGTALYAGFALAEAGGLGALRPALERRLEGALAVPPVDALLAFTPGEAPSVSLLLLSAFGLQWLVQMNADGTGYLAQRCMACRSDADATRATWVFSVTQVLVRSLLWLPIGLALLVVYPPESGAAHDAAVFVAQREQTYVRGMAELLPVGVRGLLLTAMLAALASTIDTHLNWGASYLTNDLYGRIYAGIWRKRKAEPRQLVRVARMSNVLILAVALIVMTQLDSIQMAWKISLLLGAGMGTLLLLRWLWWRVTALSELSSIAVSSLAAPLLLWLLPDDWEALRLLGVALLSTGAGVGAALLRPRPVDEGLKQFYRRVRPPGAWGPVALAVGEAADAPRRRLWLGARRTLAACGTLFCTLVGLGSALVDGTVPRWFPAPALWEGVLWLVAAALVPLWWSGLRAEADVSSY